MMQARVFTLALILGLVAGVPPGQAQARATDDDARQVTLFGVIATPNDMRIDPKLAKIAPQLRKLLPNHGFRLLSVRTKRLATGATVTCPLGDGFTASTTLTQAVDADGKVKLRWEVSRRGDVVLESQVTTPPNQLFFCDKALGDGTRMLVGIGAR